MLANNYFVAHIILLASLILALGRLYSSNDYIKFHVDDKVFISKSSTCDMNHWTKKNVILKLVWWLVFPQNLYIINDKKHN